MKEIKETFNEIWLLVTDYLVSIYLHVYLFYLHVVGTMVTGYRINNRQSLKKSFPYFETINKILS